MNRYKKQSMRKTEKLDMMNKRVAELTEQLAKSAAEIRQLQGQLAPPEPEVSLSVSVKAASGTHTH